MLQSPQTNPSDLVISTLEANGSSLFAKLLYRSNKLLNLLNNKQVNLILAPTDFAIQDFLSLHRKTAETLISSADGKDIIENHFSLARDMSGKPLNAINGSLIHVDKATLQTYRITNRVLVGEIAIIIIGIVIATPQQIKPWTTERSAGLKTAFGGGDIGNVGLGLLIQQGQIRGNDLINLCSSSFETNEFCNKKDANGLTIFHQQLEREFGLRLGPDENARAEYLNIHRKAAYTYFTHPAGTVNINPTQKAFKIGKTQHLEAFAFDQTIICLGVDRLIRVFRLNPETNTIDHLPNRFVTDGRVDDAPKIRKMTYLGTTGFNSYARILAWSYNGRVYMGNLSNQGIILESIKINIPHEIVDISESSIMYRDLRAAKMTVHILGDGQNATYLPAPLNAVALQNHGKSIIDRGNKCTIYMTANGQIYDLNNPPGATFQCDADHVFFNSSKTERVIIDDAGEIWFSNYSGNWDKIPLPDNSKVIDVNTTYIIDQAFNRTITAILDDRGRVFLLGDGFVQVIKGNLQLNAPIVTLPGLVKIFPTSHSQIPHLSLFVNAARTLPGSHKILRLNY